MESRTVLVVEDDRELAELMVDYLRRAGFEAVHAADGREGLRKVWELRPNLVTVDFLMPQLDGWELVRRIREISDLPIIAVSVSHEIEDRLKAFDLGVDDFLGKPFAVPELVARVKARLRSVREESVGPSVFGPLVVDFETQEVSRNGSRVHLTPIESRLLRYLADNRNRVVTRRQILSNVWHTNDDDLLSYVKVYVYHLRNKIEDDQANPKLIVTAPYRSGYMLAV